MHFDLDQDERDLQAGIRELLAGRCDVERVRAAARTDGVDRGLVAELAESGVFALRVQEADGGLGLGMTHAAVVAEELGRSLTPGPVIAQSLAAGFVDGAADGSMLVGAIDRDRGRGVVAHLPALDTLVVVDDEGLWQVAPSTLAGVAADRPLDPVTPVWHVADLPQGERIGEAADAATWRNREDVLRAAMLVGIAARTTELAVAYAKEREQFGKAIGAFQAVKHLCADMLARAEVARASLYNAAVRLDDPSLGDPGAAVAGALVQAVHAAEENGKTCIHVHGGMGFTWEVDAHLFLKRAYVLAASGRTAHEAEEVLAASL